MSVITVRTSQGLRKVQIAGDEPTLEEIAHMRELFEEVPQGSPQPYMPDAGGTQTMPPPDLTPQRVPEFIPEVTPQATPQPTPPELKPEYLSPEERELAERKGKALRLVEQAYEQGEGVQSRVPGFMKGGIGRLPENTYAGGLGKGVGKMVGSVTALAAEAGGDTERAKQIDENIARIPRGSGLMGLTEDMGQLLTAGLPITKAANALKLDTLPKIATIGAATGLAGWSGQQGRIADFVKEHTEIAKPVIDFLATDADDSFAMGRLKNALEFAGVDTAVATPFVLAFRAWKGIAASAKPHGEVELAKEISKGVKKANPNHVVRPPKNGNIQVAHAGAIQIPDKVVEAVNKPIELFLKGGSRLMQETPLSDKMIVPLKSRVERMSPRMAHVMDKFELEQNLLAADHMNRAVPFLKSARKMSKVDRESFSRFAMNSEIDKANAILRKYKNNGKAPGIMREFEDLRNVFDELHELGNANALEIPYTKNYLPRIMKDYDGFLKAIGKDAADPIEDAIRVAQAEKMERLATIAKKGGTPAPDNANLTQFERREAIRKYLEGSKYTGDGTPGLMKERVIKKIDPKHMKYYGSFEENVQNYINNVTYRVAKNRFTGQVEGVTGYTDEIARLADEGKISGKQAIEIDELINTRLTGGEQSINKGLQVYRDAMYLSSIGNPISTITQSSEFMLNAYRNGLLETLQTAPKTFKRAGIKLKDLGLDDIAREFSDPLAQSQAGKFGSAQKALNKTLRNTLRSRFVMFKQMDELMKESNLNGALLKAKKLVANKNSKEYKEFAIEQARFFEGETDSFINALRRGDVNDPNVKVYLFSQLAKTQPISLSEYSQFYLKNPNARPFYFLKSFGLKQLETTRRDILRKIGSGNAKEIREGFQQGIRLSVLFGGGMTGTNLFKDWLLERDEQPGMTPTVPKAGKAADAANDAVMTLFGLSRYFSRKFADDPFRATIDLVVPPKLSEWTEMFVESPMKGDLEQFKRVGTKQIPIVGKIYSEHWGANADYKRKKRVQEQRRGGRRGPQPPGPPKPPSPPKPPRY